MMLFPPLFGVFSVVYPCLQVLLLFVYKRQYKKARGLAMYIARRYFSVCALGDHAAFGSFLPHFVCAISHMSLRRRRRRSDISSITANLIRRFCGKTMRGK
jgi:hypothetical protein